LNLMVSTLQALTDSPAANYAVAREHGPHSRSCYLT
jgi:hypothetical protein